MPSLLKKNTAIDHDEQDVIDDEEED